MQLHCSAYTTDDDARAAVDQMLAAGTAPERITVLSGSPAADHSDDPVGGFAGASGSVRGFAGRAHSHAESMGDFASNGGTQRRGSFADADKDTITSYENGVLRARVASHRELEHRLIAAGLDAGAARADVAALHQGRVLVLVEQA